MDTWDIVYECDVILPENEEKRLQVLAECQISKDSLQETEYDRYTAFAQRYFKSASAALCIVDADMVWTKSTMGFPAPLQVPRKMTLCAHSVMQNEAEVVVVNDTMLDPRFCNNPFFNGTAMAIRFYAAGVLIIEGCKVGTLSIFDNVPREFSISDKATLFELAASVTALLRSRRDSFLQQRKYDELLASHTDLLHNIRTPLTSVNCEFALLQEESAQIPNSVASMVGNLGNSISALNLSVGSEFGGLTSDSTSAKEREVKRYVQCDVACDTPSTQSPSAGQSTRKVKVLLVEDSVMIQRVMRKWLESNGCEVHSELNGLLGLNKAKAESFDIMITDFLMPVMDGLECLKRLTEFRAHGGSAPVINSDMVIIGMSATANEADQKEAFMYGMHSFCVKPVDLNLLKLAIGLKAEGSSLERVVRALKLHNGADGSHGSEKNRTLIESKQEKVSSVDHQVTRPPTPTPPLAPLDITPDLMQGRKRSPIATSSSSTQQSVSNSPLSATVRKSPKLKPIPATKPLLDKTSSSSTIVNGGGSGSTVGADSEQSKPGSAEGASRGFLSGALNLLRGNSGRITPVSSE